MIRYLLSTEPDSIISIPSKRVISKSKPIHKNTSLLYHLNPERALVCWFVLSHPNLVIACFNYANPKFLLHFATGKEDHPEGDGSIGWANPSPAILGYFPYRADRFLFILVTYTRFPAGFQPDRFRTYLLGIFL